MSTGMQIPQTNHIRILGQANCDNSDQSVIEIGRLLKRVANKHAGMRESNLLRLVQAFAHASPCALLDRIDASLRKTYNTTLGLHI